MMVDQDNNDVESNTNLALAEAALAGPIQFSQNDDC